MSELPPVKKFGRKKVPKRSYTHRVTPQSTTPLGKPLPQPSWVDLPDEVLYKSEVYTPKMVYEDSENAFASAEVLKEKIPLLRDSLAVKEDELKRSYTQDKYQYGGPTVETLQIGTEVNSIRKELTETENFFSALMEWLEMD